MSAVCALESMMKMYCKELVLIGLHVHVGGGCKKTVQKTVCKMILVMITSVLCVLIYLLHNVCLVFPLYCIICMSHNIPCAHIYRVYCTCLRVHNRNSVR